MKKLTLALMAAISLSTAAFADTQPPVQGERVAGSQGQIKFKGFVTEKGCTIVTGNNSTINLGTISKASLFNTGYSGWTEGQIQFIDCNLTMEGEPASSNKLTSVELTILPSDQTTIDPNQKAWTNQGVAKGVGVEVKIAGDKPAQEVPPTGITEAIEARIHPVNDTAIYTVYGRMVKTAKEKTEITPGSVEATLTFQANYR